MFIPNYFDVISITIVNKGRIFKNIPNSKLHVLSRVDNYILENFDTTCTLKELIFRKTPISNKNGNFDELFRLHITVELD